MSVVATSKQEALDVSRGGVQKPESLLCCVEIGFSQIHIGV
jgi:hypothetical protein